MNRLVVSIMAFATSTILTASAYAADFFGATVTNREATAIAWKAGIVGLRPVVEDVPSSSPAAKYGLKQGEIILSINGKAVRDANELKQFTTDILSVYVLDGAERKILKIDRLAIEKEKADIARIEAERKAARMKQINTETERADDSPPVIFNDTTLYIRSKSEEQNKPASDEKSEKKEGPVTQ